MNTDFTNCPS
jgi:hypothetical protein